MHRPPRHTRRHHRDEDGSAPAVAILRFAGDADAALAGYERAAGAWRERFGERFAEPELALAGPGDGGGLVVVNVFASGDDLRAFGPRLGRLLADAGLPEPQVELLAVRPLAGPAGPLGAA